MAKPLRFYAIVDDLIGGYAVSQHNKPLSEHDTRSIDIGGRGEYPIGEFISKEWAIRVAVALNTIEDPDYNTASDRAHAILGLGPGIVITAAAIEGIVDGALRK